MASTEAPKRTRARKPASASANGNVKVVPEDFLRIIRFLDTRVLVERSLELRVILLALLSGVNVHLLGPPGTAKSLALREFAKSIVGSRYFEKQLNAGMPPDAVMGSVNIPLLTTTGEYEIKVDGKLPTADLALVDEWFRANGLMLDAMLPIANTEERQYEQNGTPKKSNLKMLSSASNHMPDADNEQAQALVDRITLMCLVEPVKSDDSFQEIVRRHHDRRTAEAAGAWDEQRETMRIEQVAEAQRQVNAITPMPEFLGELATLRRETIAEGLHVSDRRWVELVRVCRANGWLAGRDHLIAEDLAVVEHGLWRERSQIPVAHKLVLRFHGRYEREASTKRTEITPVLAELEQIRPTVESLPPSADLSLVDAPDQGDGKKRTLIGVGMSISRRVDRMADEIDALLADAGKEKRDAASLRDLANELLAARIWLKAQHFPTTYAP